jgi:hypothetical protein
MQNWLKRQPETFLKNLWNAGTGTLKLRGLRWKVILVSFLYIYNKCACFEKSFYFLTYLLNINVNSLAILVI